MRKGFTMIELIFVIVILGVLASVAIPRLAATRDDAELAKAATNIGIAVNDIAAYYTAKGEFASAVSSMTNVGDKIKVGSKECASITTADGTIKIEKKTADTICDTFWKMEGVKNICNSTSSTKADTDNNTPAKSFCEIKVGGSSIFGTSTTTTGGNGATGDKTK